MSSSQAEQISIAENDVSLIRINLINYLNVSKLCFFTRRLFLNMK